MNVVSGSIRHNQTEKLSLFYYFLFGSCFAIILFISLPIPEVRAVNTDVEEVPNLDTSISGNHQDQSSVRTCDQTCCSCCRTEFTYSEVFCYLFVGGLTLSGIALLRLYQKFCEEKNANWCLN